MPARAAQAAAIAGVLIVVLIGWLVATTLLAPPEPAAANVVRIPPLGEVAPIRLADGRPVFVVHHETGQINVLDGFSTHVPYGVYKMLAWCPESRIFTDLVHGALYDEWGIHRGGPALGSMIAMSSQIGAGGLLQIGGPLGPVAAGDATNPEPVDFAACTFAMHAFGDDARLTPAQAASQADGSWVVVAGVVDPQLQRLCGLAPGCSSAAPIHGLVLLDLQMDRQFAEFLTVPRLWLAQVAGGQLSHLTYIPDPDAG